MAEATFRQEMPPKGGYGAIPYKRVHARTLFRGWGWATFGGVIAITAGAGYVFHLTNKSIYHEYVECMSVKHAIYPLLLAERDREFLKQLRRNRDEEADLMKNVEGWKVGTWYGEPMYKMEPDALIRPSLYNYFVHADPAELKKRSDWAMQQ